MKLQITFKTPDVVEDAIKDATFAESECDCGLCPDCSRVQHERKSLTHSLEALAERYFRWNEYVTIELDTETGTATVVPIT